MATRELQFELNLTMLTGAKRPHRQVLSRSASQQCGLEAGDQEWELFGQTEFKTRCGHNCLFEQFTRLFK